MSKKFETMFVVHVRYDINQESIGTASDVAGLIQQSVANYIKYGLSEPQPFDNTLWFKPSEMFVSNASDVDSSEFAGSAKSKVTFAAVTDSITDEASSSRHTPNVWLVGSLRNMRNMLRTYNANRFVSKFNRLAERVRQFDSSETISENADSYCMPVLPLPTMQLAISRMRNKQTGDLNQLVVEQLQEQVLDILDGLFEDGLPIDHTLTRAESRMSNPEPF